jgi:hypothetical protein
MLAQSVASPFSGAVIPPSTPKTKNKNKNNGRGKGSSNSTADGRPPKWGPSGTKQQLGTPPNFSGGIFGGAVAPSFSQEEAYAEITRLTHLLSQANPSAAWNNFGPQQALASVYTPSVVTVPSAFFSRSERPRPCYCFVHGFNTSHDSPDCRVMSNDAQYTDAMRMATTPVGTGGNPNVGPPVRLPYRLPPLPIPVCVDCLPSPPSSTRVSSKWRRACHPCFHHIQRG